MEKSLFLILLFLTLHCGIQAVSIEEYYASAEGLTGDTLKTELHKIIRGHKCYPYFSDSTGVGEMIEILDEDPLKKENLILIYSGRSQQKEYTDWGADKDYLALYGNTHDNSWNREHIWPKSHGFPGIRDTAYTDIHHLHPEDRSINGDRGTRDFDWGGLPHREAVGCFSDFDSWEPRDEVKGDIARKLFYMAVRYEGINSEYNLELVDETNTSGTFLGRLSTLLEWHELDPVDDNERRRNELIYEKFQHNRNPFIDHPEYVDSIWGRPNQNLRINPYLADINFHEVKVGEQSAPLDYVISAVNLVNPLTVTVPEDFLISGKQNVTFFPTNGRLNELVSLTFLPSKETFYTGFLTYSDSSTVLRKVKILGMGINNQAEEIDFQDFENGFNTWETVNEAGTKNWEISGYGDAVFARMGGFKADKACSDWLISPGYDLTEYESVVLSFETAKNHEDEVEGLEVLVSINTASEDDINDNQWMKLSANYSEGEYAWKHSGYIDLSAFRGEKILIAFHYWNTSPNKATTWEVDNIKLTGIKK